MVSGGTKLKIIFKINSRAGKGLYRIHEVNIFITFLNIKAEFMTIRVCC